MRIIPIFVGFFAGMALAGAIFDSSTSIVDGLLPLALFAAFYLAIVVAARFNRLGEGAGTWLVAAPLSLIAGFFVFFSVLEPRLAALSGVGLVAGLVVVVMVLRRRRTKGARTPSNRTRDTESVPLSTDSQEQAAGVGSNPKNDSEHPWQGWLDPSHDVGFDPKSLLSGDSSNTLKSFVDGVFGLRRDAWLPQFSSSGRVFDSKYGGYPYISEEFPWPPPNADGEEFRFIFQLRLDELPSTEGFRFPSAPTLLQIFVPDDDEGGDDPGPADTRRIILRSFEIDTDSEFRGRAFTPSSRPLLEERFISGWERFNDYPDSEVVKQELNIEALSQSQWHILNFFQTLSADKVMGWPFYCQYSPGFRCEKCSRELAHLFQLGATHIDDPWFTYLTHLLVCPEHVEEIVFYWDK